MNAMQYKITFPENFDMGTIRDRVKNNGSKTDGFTDLMFKAYLIKDTKTDKEYAPLYIWRNSEGMNKFIFDGYFDNILDSFGWQNINIGVPLQLDLREEFANSKYCLEMEHNISETDSLSRPSFSNINNGFSGRALVYNPEKWKYVEFYFYKDKPQVNNESSSVYEILHISE